MKSLYPIMILSLIASGNAFAWNSNPSAEAESTVSQLKIALERLNFSNCRGNSHFLENATIGAGKNQTHLTYKCKNGTDSVWIDLVYAFSPVKHIKSIELKFSPSYGEVN